MKRLAALVVVAGWFPGALFAAPVTRERAEAVAKHWLRVNREVRAFGGAGNARVIRVRVFRGADSGGTAALAYIADVKPRGFIIIPADDRLVPVLAFSLRCNYDLEYNDDFPLTAMLEHDLPDRLANAATVPQTVRNENKRRWARLEAGGGGGKAGILNAVTPVVDPFVATSWGQGTGKAPYTYNKYTPKNYVTGCVATATGQIMKYFEYPPKASGSGTIRVDGKSQTVTFSRTYDWDNMPKAITQNSSTKQIDAVAYLLVDVGTAVKMQYASSGSGAYLEDVGPALTGVFGYDSADLKSSDDSDFYDKIREELDKGYPVELGISGTAGGHAVVADGYGTDAGTYVYHLNMGWEGAYDAWYTLPKFTTGSYSWTTVWNAVYNIRSPAKGPDLTIKSFTMSPTTGLITDERTITCEIRNRGTSATGRFTVAVWTDRDKQPSAGTNGAQKKWSVSKLDAMETKKLTMTFTPSAAGSFKAWAVVDYNRQVRETKESNNVAGPVNWSADQANLKIDDITVAPVRGDTSVQRKATVKIHNDGTLDISDTFKVDFWLNSKSAPTPGANTKGDQSVSVKGLKKDATQTVTFTFTPASAGSFTAWALVDTNDAVEETDEKDNAGSAAWSATLPKVDLDLVSVVVDPRTGVTTSPRTVTVTIKNSGSDKANGPFNVDFWQSRTSNPKLGSGTKGDYTWSVASLDGGETQTLTHTFTPAKEGYFSAYVSVDTTTTVAESNEKNNVRAVSWSASKPKSGPDLRVIRLTVTPETDEIGATRTIDLTIANEGTEDAADFKVDLWADRNSAPTAGAGVRGDYTWTIASLGHGENTSLQYTFAPVKKGTYKAWAEVDTTNVVAEHTETNNVLGATWKVTLPDRDLKVSLFKIVASAGSADQQRTAEVIVRNDGKKAAAAFAVAFWQNSETTPTDAATAEHTWSVPSLAGGASTTLKYEFKPAAGGKFAAWVMLDSDNQVDEANELNNTGYTSWLAGPSGDLPDFKVTDFTITPADAAPGTVRTVKVTIVNLGTTATSAALHGLWLSEAKQPTDTNQCDTVWTTRKFVYGQSKTFSFRFVPTAVGTFTAWVCADATGCIGESDETNNVLSETWSVTSKSEKSPPPPAGGSE